MNIHSLPTTRHGGVRTSVRLPLFLWPVVNIVRALWLAVSMITGACIVSLVMLTTQNQEWALAVARIYWSPWIVWGTMSSFLIEGTDEIPNDGPCIVISNHQSMLDIPLHFYAIQRSVRFLGKHTLRNVPIVGLYMQFMGMIFVNRDDPQDRRRSLEECLSLLNKNHLLLIYAEGTRSKDGYLLPLKPGAFQMAALAQVPIVVCALDGPYELVPKDSLLWKSHPLRMRFKRIEPPTSVKPQAIRQSMSEAYRILDDLHQSIGGKGYLEVPTYPSRRNQTIIATGGDLDPHSPQVHPL